MASLARNVGQLAKNSTKEQKPTDEVALTSHSDVFCYVKQLRHHRGWPASVE